MPRAAPGVIASGKLRRTIPRRSCLSVRKMGRYVAGYSSPLGKEIHFHPGELEFHKSFYFTLHLSGFGVERGRLGEVESLVGDCRPPPPGNPHQPTFLICTNPAYGGLRKNPVETCNGLWNFSPKWQKNGGVFLPMCKYPSLTNVKNRYNLKKLISTQYFKNNYSYFSCTEIHSVLKFAQFHCHLYGVWSVEPPSIAITNVLGKWECYYALPLL
jgi:hypothetical protein